MEFDMLTEEEYIPLLPMVQDISEKIKNSVRKTQLYIITFHGEQSECKIKHQFPNYEGELFPDEEEIESDINLYIKEGKNICIQIPSKLPTPSSSPSSGSFFPLGVRGEHFSDKITPLSFIFNGLKNNYIKIDKKMNHVMLRECKNVTLELMDGTVSGIDILRCSRLKIKTLLHNYTNIEYVSSTDVYGAVDSVTQIFVRNSQDIKFENISLPVNVFTSQIFTREVNTFKRKDVGGDAEQKITLLRD